MQTRTVCQECACMPKLPEHERGLVVTVHDYEEIMRVKFPREVVKITRIVVDGEEQEPSGELTSTSALEDYFRSILGATAKVQYTGGKIRITTDKALKDFEYEVNGDGNHALFNKKDTRTIELGTNNFYLFETTFDGTGRWVKYEVPTFSASDVTYDGSETNVQDAIDATRDKANNAKLTANQAKTQSDENKEKIDNLDTRVTDLEGKVQTNTGDIATNSQNITNLTNEVTNIHNNVNDIADIAMQNQKDIEQLKNNPVSAELYEEGTDLGIKIGATKLKTGHNETVNLQAGVPKVITHNLNTKFVISSIYESATHMEAEVEEELIDENSIKITAIEDISVDVVIKR